MDRLLLKQTTTALWQSLVSEAAESVEHSLDEDRESYLVFLLMRFANRPDMAASILALDYLESSLSTGKEQHDKLRDVGDQCLLYSGLFPQRAERRRVKLSYYVELGRSAYYQLSDKLGNAIEGSMGTMYADLCKHFVSLMDVLQAMRELGSGRACLEPLQAIELFHDTGSRSAARSLRAVTDDAALFIQNTRFKH